ncbi:MAG: GNAT family N-acetyltransferase [Bdellovibrionales bacterium]
MISPLNDVEFVLYSGLLVAPVNIQQYVWSLLWAADAEFIPALSTRHGPSDAIFDPAEKVKDEGPVEYFAEMSKQPIIVALSKGYVVGFMAYKTNYAVPEIQEKVQAYVSTIVIDPVARGQKIAERFYKRLFKELQKARDEEPLLVATRTWSTNFSHLTILKRLGFDCVFCKKNGRKKDIDTIVYKLRLSGSP